MTKSKQNTICKNCGHEIIKRKGIWKHKSGGNYCSARWSGNKALLGGCLCNKAEPKENQDD